MIELMYPAAGLIAALPVAIGVVVMRRRRHRPMMPTVLASAQAQTRRMGLRPSHARR